jgi:phage-related protein (TIGR01555 family)
MFNRIRAAWRALWKSTAAPAPSPLAAHDAQIEKARELRISAAALFEARRHNAQVFLPEMTFIRAEPLPGTLPNGMALDSAATGANDAMLAYALSQYAHEGLGFLGYPYLAELSQRAEYRHVASIWAEHCTRKWIKVTGDESKVKKIEAEMKRLGIKAEFRDAIEKECFFGRMQLFMDFGDWDNPAETDTILMLDKGKISKSRPLKRLASIEPMWSYPGAYSAQNPLAPDFYRPSSWYVSGRTVHASRMLTLVGRPMPNMLKPAYAFGGVSLTQMCKPYVDNWLRARQSVSDLIHSFSTMVLATDMEQVLGGAVATDLFNRVDMFNATRDNRGTFVIDKDAEEFSNVSAPIAGLDKLQAQALEQIASVSGIPLVILLGITPSGLNASSEGEIRVFYDKITAYQEKVLGEPIETLLKVIQLSLFGEIDDEIGFEFESLWEQSDSDKAAIRKSDAEADSTYIAAGVVSPEEARDRLNDEEGGFYHGRLDGPAPEPEVEDEDKELPAEAE